MIHRAIWVLVLSVTFYQEKASGIYITIAPGRKTTCEHELRMVIGKSRVCVSKKPIVAIDEIKYITEILYDPKSMVHYIDAGLTSSGIQTLNKTVSSLPKSRFALVVDGEVVCLFSGAADGSINAIRLGEDARLEDLKTIQQALKKIDL